MGKMEAEYKKQQQHEYFSRLKARFLKTDFTYGAHPKVMTPTLFDHLFDSHFKKFKAAGRTIAFIEDKAADYDEHRFEKVSLREALSK